MFSGVLFRKPVHVTQRFRRIGLLRAFSQRTGLPEGYNSLMLQEMLENIENDAFTAFSLTVQRFFMAVLL